MSTAKTIPELANEYRRLLLRKDAQARAQMEQAIKAVQRGIERDAKRLMRIIDYKGITSENQIYRLLRYRKFMEDTERLLEEYTQQAQQQTARLAQWAAFLGDEAAQQVASGVGAGAAVGLTKLDEDALQQIVGRVLYGRAAQAFVTIPRDVSGRVANLLIAGVGRGQHPYKTAREIRRVVEIASYKAQRIARTETMTAYRDAHIRAFSSSQVVTGWVWQAAADDRTCPVCWAMHGKWFPASTPFETHVSCRCTPVGMPMSYEQARARGWVVPGEELFARLPESEKQAILGKTRYELYSSGVPLEAMVKRTYDPVWGGGRALAPIRELAFALG